MSLSSAASNLRLEPGDKATPVTIYQEHGVLQGDLVTREMIKASNWLRTPGLPDFATLFGVTYSRLGSGGAPVVMQVPELHVPVASMIAIHLTPPASEPAEHDPSETNRKLEPVTAVTGAFRFQGLLRMPQHMTVAKQMSLMRDPFLYLQEVSVSSAFHPGNDLQVMTLLMRPACFSFSPGKID